VAPNKQPQLVLATADETRLTGSFKVTGAKIERVDIDVDDTAPVLARARVLVADNKKAPARQLLQDALKSHPASPLAAELRKLLQQASK
jgi:hypothetical protein